MTRRVVKHPRSVVALVILAALALGGCDNSTSGTAGATTSTGPATTTAPQTSSQAPNSAAADPLANTDPCTLLDASIATQNGLQRGTSGTGPGTRYCRWEKNADSTSSGYSVAVNIYDHAGLDQLNTTELTVTNYPVGGHQGRLSKQNTGGGCLVSIGVTSTSRVDVAGIDGAGQQDRACTVATTVAPAVAQKLPSGNG